MTFTKTKFGANIKSLGSYRGVLSNVTFEDFQLDRVHKAINIDLIGQTSQKKNSDRPAEENITRSARPIRYSAGTKPTPPLTCA